jgi:excisionase family DNA binding protein
MATVDDQVAETGQAINSDHGVARRTPRRGGPDDGGETLLRTAEVARKLQVSTRTVLAWAQAGKLPSVLTPGGHRRYPQWGVDEVLRAMTGVGDEAGESRG